MRTPHMYVIALPNNSSLYGRIVEAPIGLLFGHRELNTADGIRSYIYIEETLKLIHIHIRL